MECPYALENEFGEVECHGSGEECPPEYVDLCKVETVLL